MRGSVSVPRLPQTGHCASGWPGVPLMRGIIGAEAVLAVPAIHERVGEAGHVAGRLPHPGVHEDGRVEALDVVAGVDHRAPPAVFDVLLELDAERAVIPDRTQAAIDLRGLEDESAALAEGDQLVHQGGVGH